MITFSEPFLASLGPSWTPLGRCYGACWAFWDVLGPPNSRLFLIFSYFFKFFTSFGVSWRVFGPSSPLLDASSAILDPPRLILEPPGTNFEASGRCFGIPNDYLGATNMRGNHHIYPVASPVDYRRSGPGGMRVAIKSAIP